MKKILLIEDDASVAHSIGVALKAMGYELITASDAVMATAAARKAAPDVILLDYNLPGGDGLIVAERLRSNANTTATPIIFITASKQANLKQRALAAGAVQFLEKPFGVTQLADAIETAYAGASVDTQSLQIG